ncbi:MAG: hypothetical protein IPK68_11060 [Bdellovibrionales bacterium]|nr:hypothetical protein [Bdellovibrionales bacterium]
MKSNSLENFIQEIKKAWGPLSTETVSKSQKLLTELAKTPENEEWISNLLSKPDVEEELYRDPENGFILLAYSEKKDLYRAPHDHGGCWVVYAVHTGEMEMKTYRSITNQKGKTSLVCRESYKVRPGESKAYLPEDIHDTKCASDSVLIFRLTSCDLKKENREGRMIRYVENS